MTRDRLKPQQKEAINTRGSNVLVSASAGTGKTTVLVQRAVSLILKDKVDIDRLLVVTFTEAAAMEMREKIRRELHSAARRSPSDGRVRRQLTLLDAAHISTIHSFCLSLLREHFHHLDLDPNFSILDPDEAELMKEEMVSDLFEDYYNDDSDLGGRFQRLVQCYGGRHADADMRRFVIQLHDYTRSLPQPEQWFQQTTDLYRQAEKAKTLGQTQWCADMRDAVLSELASVSRQYTMSVESLQSLGPEVSSAYMHFAQEDLDAVLSWISLIKDDQFEKAYEAIRSHVFRPLNISRKAGTALPDEQKERAKEIINTVRNRVKYHLFNRLCAADWDVLLDSIVTTAPHIYLIQQLVQQFAERFAEAKRRDNSLDFCDLEQLACRLLSLEATSSGYCVRAEVQSKFECVLVDEYQDINPIQDAILTMVSRPTPGNFFAVGDVKQSIYRFRLAEPGIFAEKHQAYSRKGQTRNVLVPLQHNFRSREGIIDGINAICSQLMSQRTVGVPYDENARLHYAADFPPVPGADHPPVEMHVMDITEDQEGRDDEERPDGPASTDELPDLERIEQEAEFVAWRTKELMGLAERPPLHVFDTISRARRPLEYRDIVVLLRTTRNRAETYVNILARNGIPVYAELTGGYFAASEIRDMLNLLRLLDNPRQDIPLAAVLRSPLVGLSDAELADIRLVHRDGAFLDAVSHRAEGSGKLSARLRSFLTTLQRWRMISRQRQLASLIWTIYLETGYLHYVAGLDNGAQRRANLLKLHDRAHQFDTFTHHGLRRFLDFVERIIEMGEDFGSAPFLSQAEDTVRVMSIHKSKGLEFPVVFLPDLSKSFNMIDASGDIVYDRTKSIGLKVVDLNARVRYPGLPHMIASREARLHTLAEEMRILYVGMTRAQEKLILSATAEIERLRRKWQPVACLQGESALPEFVCMGASSFLDWIWPAIARLPGGEPLSISGPKTSHSSFLAVATYDASDSRLMHQKRIAAASAPLDYKPLRDLSPLDYTPRTTPAFEQVKAQIDWEYQWMEATRCRAKMSVSELKHVLDPLRELDDLPARSTIALTEQPAFLLEDAEDISPIALGTAIHAVLRHIDLGLDLRSPGVIRQEIERLLNRKVLHASQAGAIDPQLISRFFQSDTGRRLLARPRKVMRELPFALRATGDIPLPAFSQEPTDPIVIQGIIDCAVEEDDGFLLVDFKTDRISEAELPSRVQFYEPQLIAYRAALETIFRRPVKETIIYFMYLGHAHSV